MNMLQQQIETGITLHAWLYGSRSAHVSYCRPYQADDIHRNPQSAVWVSHKCGSTRTLINIHKYTYRYTHIYTQACTFTHGMQGLNLVHKVRAKISRGQRGLVGRQHCSGLTVCTNSVMRNQYYRQAKEYGEAK